VEWRRRAGNAASFIRTQYISSFSHSETASANEITAEAEATLRADPSAARAYWAMSQGDLFLGRYEQSILHLE
jgi:hypothetical protein